MVTAERIAELRNDERAKAAGIAIVRRVLEDIAMRTNPKYANYSTDEIKGGLKNAKTVVEPTTR